MTILAEPGVIRFTLQYQVLKDHEHIDVKFDNYKVLVTFAKTSTEFRDEEFEEKDADAIANGPNVTGEILTQVRIESTFGSGRNICLEKCIDNGEKGFPRLRDLHLGMRVRNLDSCLS